MTSVPPRPPVPPARGKRHNVRTYSAWEWGRAYLALIAFAPIYATLWFLATFVKTLPPSITAKLLRAHRRYVIEHDMDFRIPPDTATPAYMHRWWRIARNWAFNIYFHIVLRSDDDRALHDHPWWNFSIVLDGGYYEHTISEGGIHNRAWCGPGTMKFRWHGKKSHRLELARENFNTVRLKDIEIETIIDGDQGFVEMPAHTIFITGPVLRRWGFHHPEQWVDAYEWDEFCADRGITQAMTMGGGSDGALSPRNHHNAN